MHIPLALGLMVFVNGGYCTIRAFVVAKVGSHEYLGASKTIKEKIAQIPGVLKGEVIFGRYDVIAEIETNDLEELSCLVTDKIKSIPSVLRLRRSYVINHSSPMKKTMRVIWFENKILC